MLVNKIKRAKQHLQDLQFLPQIDTDFEILYAPAQFKQAIIQQIRAAQKRIYITALYWQMDEAGQEILDEIYLAKHQRPELEIKILVDWHRAQRNLIGEKKGMTNADWYCGERQKQQADALFFGVPINTREVFGVLHIKGFVFDDTVLYSGASINNVYLHHQDKYRYDRYQKIKNAGLADALVEFINAYLLVPEVIHALDNPQRPTTKELRHQIKAFRRHLAHYGRYQVKEATRSGEDLSIAPLFGLSNQGNLLNRTIEDLFMLVEEKLTICTPYFNFPRSLQGRIRHLLKEGKKIEIIVGDKTANDFYIPPQEPFKMAGALPYLYEKNLRAFARKFEAEIERGALNIRIWKDEDNSYHLKGIWVDNRYMLLTGNNLNPRAWRLDAENGLLIHDPQQRLRPQAEQELEYIRRHTERLNHYSELEDLPRYPAPVQRILKRFQRVKADKLVKMIL
ncbi:CDP-diacylglycerol--serine O-phosphatidyltransferase [Mesocricetibacter intestinalis]|uniref:CDP-diacylglycerol--serine O-phosphatidyltransferase n=1 Tax=Mesocricetibacter intestinalis TaxID=1521930 RepID=A0A4R6VA07_9PAST|nr:CDP-diacylglycerol--serine O-phosphatidyltransferase [Mesocricetibacter intestinalis]TDQ56513.1 CDP-diacylglycerol--serine O-phosphatidyltransferase [Mesocricetibacter intestinalis]